ncbi:putative odorant receptor 85e [Bradysia coprophila]|uniref:putative odorant receptor 85e n=1 Tax=Bradysia coprophila TaxID=38358 RepID=UPI00187DCD29|nr:putative odorant receptor 85e [Bradysia coprophila]
MAAKRLSKIENYFSVQTVNLVFVGIWFNVEKILNISPRITRILNWIYDIFILTLLSHILILYFITLKAKLGYDEISFNEITDAVSQINVYGFTTFMHYYCRIRSKRHIELLNYVNRHFRFRSNKGLTYVTSERIYFITKTLSFYWTLTGVVSTLKFGLTPIITRKRMLPLKLMYPFETLESPTYEILMILQSIAQVNVGFGFLICVNFGVVIAMLIGTQYDILAVSNKNILHTAMFNAGRISELRKLQEKHEILYDDSNVYYMSKEEMDNLDDGVNPTPVQNGSLNCKSLTTKPSSSSPKDSHPKLYNELRDALRENVLHHQTIIEAHRILEDIMSPIILVKYTQVTTLLCTLFVTILKISGPVMVSFIEYGMMAIFDLAMLCYAGEIIKTESLKVGDALLRSQWYRFDVKFQRLIVIVLANTQKSLVITGGKFFNLGWDLFVTSLKLSFSCFTLLNKLGNN